MLACTIVVVFVALVNVIGFTQARRDKRAAGRANRSGAHIRTPERLFYLVSLLGGWPATALAFKMYRHKTRKVRFLVPFWGSAALGAIALVGWWLALGCETFLAL